ncbi:MAG: hypothetical protein MUC71_10425 [Steroidobacteraceae bacterium]|nr:hypothetical protein [Steroidobacteraceae bacterium]
MKRAYRRSNYDVTDAVQVSSPAAVRAAVLELYANAWPGADLSVLGRSIDDFTALFTGSMPGYIGVDTVYHDLQHSLDMVLAATRLMVGYERTAAEGQRLGPERALAGIVTALFHDAGYIRESSEADVPNGAVFTRSHVTRSARYLGRYLPRIGLSQWVPVCTRIVHFTGYEVPFDQIRVTDDRDRKVGHLIGTADLLAQMSDRCYLEKCRDRLYAEFVLGGVAVYPGTRGVEVVYGSGLDLLRQTPAFVRAAIEDRLEGAFDHAYRHVEPLFGGANPYLEAIQQNVAHLNELLRTGRWPMLRRSPPVYTVQPDPMRHVRELMVEQLERTWGPTPSPFAGRG